jgi:hypothetical protein
LKLKEEKASKCIKINMGFHAIDSSLDMESYYFESCLNPQVKHYQLYSRFKEEKASKCIKIDVGFQAVDNSTDMERYYFKS